MALRFRKIMICLCVSSFILFTTTVALASSMQFPKTFENLEMVQLIRESYLEFFKTELNITDENVAKEMVVKLLPDTYRPFTANLCFENEKSFDHFKQSFHQNIKDTFSQPKYKDVTNLLQNNASEFKRIADSFEVMKDTIGGLNDLQKEYNEISILSNQATEMVPDFIEAIKNSLIKLKPFSTDDRASLLYTDFEETAWILIDLFQNPDPAKLEKYSREGLNFTLVLKTIPDSNVYNDYADAANALFDEIFDIDRLLYDQHVVPVMHANNSFTDINRLLRDKILDIISELNPESNETYTVDFFFVFLKDVIEKLEDLLETTYSDSKYFYNGNPIYKFLNGDTPEEYLCKSFLDATKEAVKSTQIKHFPNLKEGSHEKASNDNSSKPENDGNFMKEGTSNSSTCLVVFLLILFAVIIIMIIIIVATITYLKRKKTKYIYLPRYFV